MRSTPTLAVALAWLFAAGPVVAWAKAPPPPKNDMDRQEKRPKLETSDEIDTMLGAMIPPEGFESKASTTGQVKLASDGMIVVIDELAAETVEDGGYTAESVRMILAKQFEPRVVKDPEEPDDDAVVLRFRGFGTTEDGTVGFRLDLVEGVSGAGMVLTFGPNSRRAEMDEIGDEILDRLPL